MVLPAASSRQVLAWSLPTLAFVLSILWYRRRNRGPKPKTDPGGTSEDAVDKTVAASFESPPDECLLSGTSVIADKPTGTISLIEEEEELDQTDSTLSVSNLSEVIPIDKLSDVQASVTASDFDNSVNIEDIVLINSSHISQLESESEAVVQQLEIALQLKETDKFKTITEEEEGQDEQVNSVSVDNLEATELTEQPAESVSLKEQEDSSIMTEVEEQSVVASQGDTVDTSEVAASPVLSKISVDVPKAAEEEEEAAKALPHQPRDSANHSPAETMLASPSISNDSDTHSVGSNDSGKGGSDVTTPVVEEEVEGNRGPGKKRSIARGGSRRTSTSSRSSGSSEPGTSSHTAIASRPHNASGSSSSSVAIPPSNVSSDQGATQAHAALPCIYEFVIPQQLVGRLIGKHGCFVHQIKSETNSNIFVKRHPESPKFKVCAVEGTQADVEGALKLIRKKFPVKKYPLVTLERVVFLPPVVSYPLIPESLQMYLVECVNNDVILSSLVSAGHMFLQQPTHPTFPMLSRLIMSMTQCYSEEDSPALPNLAPGIVCAAPSLGSWYRAEVIDVRTATPEELEEREHEDAEEITVCDIKFVDYGGYMTLPSSDLRQIRTDFMMLPFQATECYLADITWPDGEECWSAEATQCVEELIKDQVLQAQVVGYADNCTPFIRLFSIVGHMAVMVNEVLVHRGLAKYFTPLLE